MSENKEVFSIQLRGDLLRRLPELKDGNTLVKRLARFMDEQNQLTVAHIQTDYLRFPSTEPTTLEGLRFMSGRYFGSLRASKTVTDGGTLTSGIGTNIKSKDGVSYPAVHEFGAEIPPHEIRAKKGKVLRFFDSEGNPVFRKVVHFPGATIPARKPIQRGIQDRLNNYVQAFNSAIEEELKNLT